MKRDDQNINSKHQILQAAIQEFGTKSFESASITNICSGNDLSKGRIYHYFESKDAIFLACVADCFEQFRCYLDHSFKVYKEDPLHTVKEYFSARYDFFNANPALRNIFITAQFRFPAHLQEKIKLLRQPLDEVNIRIVNEILQSLPLRNGVSLEEVEEYLTAFEEFFYVYFKRKQATVTSDQELIALYETCGYKAIDFLLYGIAKQEHA